MEASGGTVGDRAGKGHTSGIWVYARRFGDGTLVTHGSSSKIFGGSFRRESGFGCAVLYEIYS